MDPQSSFPFHSHRKLSAWPRDSNSINAWLVTTQWMEGCHHPSPQTTPHSMSVPTRIRAFIATSLDGYIASKEADPIAWLNSMPPGPNGADGGYGAFMKSVKCLVMGRKTYDAVNAMNIPWPYSVPVWVATHTPLGPEASQSQVRTCSGSLTAILAEVEQVIPSTTEKDVVYLDGSHLIQQAISIGILHSLTITLIPVLLGDGISLFPRQPISPQWLRLEKAEKVGYNSLMQMTYVPVASMDEATI